MSSPASPSTANRRPSRRTSLHRFRPWANWASTARWDTPATQRTAGRLARPACLAGDWFVVGRKIGTRVHARGGRLVAKKDVLNL